jgi:hypothetical protein
MFARQCEAVTDHLPEGPTGMPPELPPPLPTGLDDPHYAAFAWARFRAIMGWMILAAAVCAAAVIVAMAHLQGPLHLVTMLAVIGGVGGSVTMAGLLMGLAFLSSGSGHDEDVTRID